MTYIVAAEWGELSSAIVYNIKWTQLQSQSIKWTHAILTAKHFVCKWNGPKIEQHTLHKMEDTLSQLVKEATGPKLINLKNASQNALGNFDKSTNIIIIL